MISFNTKNYKTRLVHIDEFGEVLISVESLNSDLINQRGSYISTEAEFIDQQIFYFVSERQIDLPIKQLIKLVKTEVL